MPGLWKVQDWSAPWGTPLYKGVLVYAEDKASAEAQAFPVLALLGGSTQNCNTHFYGTGTPASATQYNTRLAGEVVRKWEKRIETLEKDLADARASLEEAKVANGRAFAAIMLLGPTEDSEERI